MRYLFENARDSLGHVLLNAAYPGGAMPNSVFVGGNQEFYESAYEILNREEDYVVAYIDMVPGNSALSDVYADLQSLSESNDHRLIIIPIVCFEYHYMLSIASIRFFPDCRR